MLFCEIADERVMKRCRQQGREQRGGGRGGRGIPFPAGTRGRATSGRPLRAIRGSPSVSRAAPGNTFAGDSRGASGIRHARPEIAFLHQALQREIQCCTRFFAGWLTRSGLWPERIYTMHGSGLVTADHLARLRVQP